jgi:predicted DNA-binding transcriptional regulator AlpA
MAVATPEIIRPTAAGGPWLTVAEAAARMGYAESTLHEWRSKKHRGRPRGKRLGRRVWYSESEIDRFVENKQE